MTQNRLVTVPHKILARKSPLTLHQVLIRVVCVCFFNRILLGAMAFHEVIECDCDVKDGAMYLDDVGYTELCLKKKKDQGISTS